MGSNIDASVGQISNEEYRQRRRLVGNIMSNTYLNPLEPMIQKHVNTCIIKMRQQMEKGGNADVWIWMHFLTADVIGEIAYGQDFGMLATEKHEVQNNKDGETKPTLFSRLMKRTKSANPDDKQVLTEHQVHSEALTYILGGADTGAITATFLIWVILRNPVIRQKLEAELLEAQLTKPDDTDYIPDKILQELPYLTDVLKETLRMYSAAQNALPRVVPEGGRQLGPYFFPAGTEV
ncbi:hypothetical protein AA313_de0208009 [Arthrobotrys entomopaga]|nr:hypothetical protein AA313_de0208009 [Arthrobotrys entomopaga]